MAITGQTAPSVNADDRYKIEVKVNKTGTAGSPVSQPIRLVVDWADIENIPDFTSGVQTITAADKSIIVGGTAEDATIKVNTNYQENGKNYPVKVADSGLYVNVPWEDTNTQYTGGTGITINDSNVINHSNSITARTTTSLLKLKYDAQGHITGEAAVTESDVGSLVKSYGKIKVDTTTTEASKYKDTVEFVGDSWVNIAATDGSADADKITFSHKTGASGTVGNNTFVTQWTSAAHRQIKVPKVVSDSAGHITSLTDNTVTIPIVGVATMGIAPRAVANTVLMTDYNNNVKWEGILVIDGGNANTGLEGQPADNMWGYIK